MQPPSASPTRWWANTTHRGEQCRPIHCVFLPGSKHVHGENARTETSEVSADAAFDRAVVRVVGIVSAIGAADRLARHHEPPVSHIDAVLDFRCPTACFGVAGAAGQAGIADHRKRVGGTHRIVGDDRIVERSVLPTECQRAPNRVGDAGGNLRRQPAPAAGVVRYELLILRYADRIKLRPWRIGQQPGIRIEGQFGQSDDSPTVADGLVPLDANV